MLPKGILNIAREEGVSAHWEPTPLADPPDEVVWALADWLDSSRTERIPLRDSDHRRRVAQSLAGLWRDARGFIRRTLPG